MADTSEGARGAGGRRQEAGGRRQEAGGRRQKAESRRQKAESRRQKAGGRRTTDRVSYLIRGLLLAFPAPRPAAPEASRPGTSTYWATSPPILPAGSCTGRAKRSMRVAIVASCRHDLPSSPRCLRGSSTSFSVRGMFIGCSRSGSMNLFASARRHRYEEVTGFREAAAKKYSEKHFVSIGELPIGIRRHIERLF